MLHSRSLTYLALDINQRWPETDLHAESGDCTAPLSERAAHALDYARTLGNLSLGTVLALLPPLCFRKALHFEASFFSLASA